MANISVWKLVGFCGLVGLGSFALPFLILNQWYCNPLKHQTQLISGSADFAVQTGLNAGVHEDLATQKMKQIIKKQREKIRDNMKDDEYFEGVLEDLVIESNGTPIRNIISATWRSGSTFLSEVMTAQREHFYHFEPLLDFGIVQIRGPPLAVKALTRLKALLHCDYAELDKYMEYGKIHPVLFNHSTNVWKICESHKDLCHNHEFVDAMCKLFPFQLMKLLRLSLNVAQELLADGNLAVRIVYLVRDPRGTIQSRKSRSWCPGVRDCSDPALLCADLASDYKVAVKLQKKYPTSFRVIRYEDLSAEPYEHVEKLANFFGIGFHPKMKDYLDTHTKQNYGGPYSTFRDSKQAPYHWKKELKFEEVHEIQQDCITAMRQWGYVPALNTTHQREFHPVMNYTLK